MENPNHAMDRAAFRRTRWALMVLICIVTFIAICLLVSAEMCSTTFIVIALAILACMALRRYAFKKTVNEWTDQRCMQCGYLLIGHTIENPADRCPECGRNSPGSYLDLYETS